MELKDSLSHLPGIGFYFAQKLRALNLVTVEDLITHFPFRYDDFTNVSSAIEAQVGEKVTLVGEIWSITNVYTRSRKVLTQAVFNDGTTPINLTWFNQSWLTKQIAVGDRLQISGKLTKYKDKFTVVAPVWERVEKVGQVSSITGQEEKGTSGAQNSLHTGRLVPVYPETFGLTSKWIRAKIATLLPQVKDQIVEPLPDEIRQDMLPLIEAIDKIHFPNDLKEAGLARDRLSFDELFFIQLATQKTRLEWKSKPIIQELRIKNEELSSFLEGLPFKLTGAQIRVIGEIREDLEKGQPMNRLVQGEVGSGKTVVAAAIAYLVHLNKLKTLYMAPTEILAFQHHKTLTNLLSPYGISVGIYTGSKKYTKNVVSSKYYVLRENAKQKSHNTNYIIHNTDPQVIVGTHALLSEKLLPQDVGLIIVDEQQRFGVEQRTILRNKAKIPHFLTMTATPIPRTVALTLYGDLDLSIINELPKGRKEIKTFVVPSKKREDAYKFIDKKVKEGDQVYIITPLIELSETLVSSKAAKVEFEKLRKDVFPHLKLGLLHGRLKSKEKEQAINDFKEKKIDILVSTSVVEVGVDAPNATIMVIEGAERFGLAQLHQLRGRVGRGEKESYTFLFAGEEVPQVISRLKNLEKTNDGLKLAELDLKIRGSGEIFGTRQSGRFELKVASFSDVGKLEKTRDTAREILAKDPTLEKYPQLRLKLQSLTPGVMPD